ncbi:MAG: NAD-binding protein [Propionibacteriales bacterium]|nr:NAD-binding protein [Propionibacteriales bacterium]
MGKPTASERLRYWFDNWMSRGTVALMGLLGLATIVLVVVVGTLAYLFRAFPDDAAEGDLFDLWWGGLMRTLDPGTMGGDAGWPFRVFMLTITIGGLIIVASLIGIISGAFDDKVAELRKGRSRVLESDHTLILGWSSKVHPIVNELAIANESRRKAAVVILAPKDKIEMDDEIKAECPKLGRTSVICRNGDPKNLTDLGLGSPFSARSIILLAPEDSADPDADVIKTALALTNNPNRGEEKLHIVAELSDPENLEVAKLVGRDEVHWVLGPEVIGRITVQSCRQSGLSVVYQEFLDFDGDEIYFTQQPSLVGKTYFDAQLAFNKCAAMGLVVNDTPLINPPAETMIGADDQIIVVASDDSEIALGVAPDSIDTSALAQSIAESKRAERTLVLNVNAVLPVMVGELDEYVAPGSEVVIVNPSEIPDMPTVTNLTVTHVVGDPTKRPVLDRLDVGSFDHIILLADTENYESEQADSRTLVTLLHLRDLAERNDLDLNIVSEMLDDANRELAEVARADDLIVSDKLVALMLSQISENRGLADVFTTLFESEGSEVYLRPAEAYVQLGTPVNFYSVLEAARRRGETALGYRVAEHAHHSGEAYGVRVNPEKSDQITFSKGDRIVVLAED